MIEACMIAPDEVVASYRALGVAPVRYTYVWWVNGHGQGDRVTGCCGLTAVVVARGLLTFDAVDEDFERVGPALGLTSSWWSGFVGGFDEGEADGEISRTSEDFQSGYACGRAAWQAVVEAGLAEAADDGGD